MLSNHLQTIAMVLIGICFFIQSRVNNEYEKRIEELERQVKFLHEETSYIISLLLRRK